MNRIKKSKALRFVFKVQLRNDMKGRLILCRVHGQFNEHFKR